jgi:pimeloyl-ACP methyl ester carboxylesterase
MTPKRSLIALTLLTLATAPAAAEAGPSSLYSGPAPRPGPKMLYEKPATAPQLRNHGIWHAKPILISGASAYRDGEFEYQDFIYDDNGARGTGRDPNDPRVQGDTFSAPNGTYTYPTAKPYRGNAADLVEFRAKPLHGATAFRLTLNTLRKPGLVATTIAIGDSAEAQQFPFGANATAPAQLFLTVHGHKAVLQDAASGKRKAGPAPRVSISKRRNQIEVRVSHKTWNPGNDTVRLAAGLGLWDKAARQYKIPGPTADETHPGGAIGLANPTAFFNAAFRPDEPWPAITENGGTGVLTDPAWWRDKQQGHSLAANDMSPFHADVDFGKLSARTDDESAVPDSGPMDRILSSHFKTGEGTNYAKTCGDPTDCKGELRGRLQPYAIYVPEGGEPDGGYGMTLLLHSLGANYNQFADSNNQSQFGDRGQGSIVITPSGRGPDGWYYGHAGADTFEVWADVAKRYGLNPDWTAIAGYSMGGYGTYKFAAQYPDLFAKAQPTVGPPGLGVWIPPAPPEPGGDASNTNRMLASVRHIPFLIWDGTNDELVPVAGPVAQAQTFDDLGLRYIFDLFAPPVDHFALAVNDQYQPAADFLGTDEVDRNPNHVTYVVNPAMDFKKTGTVADHAYWVSKLRLSDASGDAPLGQVDAVSQAFGDADPVPGATQHTAGSLTGGTFPALGYAETSKDWDDPEPLADSDTLVLDLQNIKSLHVSADRAQLSCHPDIEATTDAPAKLHLDGCGRVINLTP